EEDSALASFSFGGAKIGKTLAIDVCPNRAAPGFGRLAQRQDLNVPFLERAGERVGAFALEGGNLRASGFLGDRDHFSFVVAVKVVRPERANRRQCKMNLRTQLAGLVLQAETKRVWTVPVHQQQILPPIAVDVQDLDGPDGAGIGYFVRLS